MGIIRHRLVETDRQKLKTYRTEQLAQATVIADLKARVVQLENQLNNRPMFLGMDWASPIEPIDPKARE